MANLIDLLRRGGTEALGQLDATGQLLKGVALQPVSGLAGASQGIADLLRGKGLDESLASANRRIEQVQGWGGGPATERGGEILGQMGETLQPVVEKLQAPADWVGEKSPLLGAAVAGFTEVADPTKVLGKTKKAASAAKQAVSKAAKSSLKADVTQAVKAAEGAADLVPRKKATLAPEFPNDPDIVSSITNDPKFKEGVPRDVIATAKANRAQYRQEPQVLPKKATEMTDQDWVDFGAQHGVDFSQTPMQSLGVSDLKTKREIMVPGGLEGQFTIPDLFRIKANNFDPAALGQDTHNQLMAKFLRTFERPGGSDPVDIYNDLNFSLLSPNAPLTQNQFIAQRGRLRNMDELNALAARGDVTPAGKTRLDPNGLWGQLDTEYGTGAASRGGLGVGGTANLGNQGTLAKLLRDKPGMFYPGEGETLRDVGYRVMNQVPGLSVKTASLGIPWSDLGKANTSAVDLHMIRHGRGRLEQEFPEFGTRVAEKVAKNPSLTPEDAAIEVISAHPPAVYRKKTGELHEDLPPYLAPEKLAYEPKYWTKPSQPYQQIMQYIDESRGANPVHELFPEQWRKWDVYRGRVEPHEMAHPDWRKLPRQSFSELQDAISAHKEAGYMGNPSTEAALYPGDEMVQPVPKQMDWRKLYYGRGTPGAMAATGAGAAGAAALINALRQKEEEQQNAVLQP